MPNISVIMPVYNHEKYLARAIESILNQTYKDFEFIIVDDGSTDSSFNIIQEYANQDKRISVIRQKNSGAAHARNEGVKKSQYKYIALMDDDDISIPTRLEKQLKFMQQNRSIDACVSPMECIDSNGQYMHNTMYSSGILPTDKEFLKYSFHPPFILGPSTMIKKKAYVECGGYRVNTVPIEDLDFTLMFQEQFKAEAMHEILYRYTLPSANIGNNQNTRNPIKYINTYIAIRINFWCRQNKISEPLYQEQPLKEIIKFIPLLPPVASEMLLRDIRPIIRNIRITSDTNLDDIRQFKEIMNGLSSCKQNKRGIKKIKKLRIKYILAAGKWQQLLNLFKH